MRLLDEPCYSEEVSVELLLCLKRLGRGGKPEAYYALACLFDNPGEGYSGYEDGNGAEMLGRYGNGKLIISR